MALKIASINSQQSLGSGATTTVNDIRLDFNCHSIHLDVFALKNSASASTTNALVDSKITAVKVSTLDGNPVTTIGMGDLFDFQVLALDRSRYASILTSTDNIPHAFGVQIPFSPFPLDPTRNFGLAANQGVQILLDSNSDGTQTFDTFVVDTTLEGLDTADKPNSLGYTKFITDSFTTGSVGSIRDTTVGVAKRLLGVYNFQTTSFDDLSASAAFDVTGVRSQAIAFSENIAASYKPSRTWSMKTQNTLASFAAAAVVTNVLDDGRFFADFGSQNDNASLGINVNGIGTNTKVKTTAGVSAEAQRVMPYLLI